MTDRLHDIRDIIEAVQELSPLEQLNLISVVSQSLSKGFGHSNVVFDFWKPRPFEEIARAQETPPVTDLADLTGSFWPDGETADDLIDYVYKQRHDDRLSEN